MTKPTLGYWDIRGIAEPIRYMLKYRNVDFEDKRYYTHTDYMDDKFNLGLDFPNLPYYVDGDVKISQSTAIIRYLAHKHGLDGKTEQERVRTDVSEQQIADLRQKLIVASYYEPDWESSKAVLLQNTPLQFQLFSDFLGKRRYLAGDRLTYVDFMAYDAFDFHWYLVPGIMDQFPKVREYVQRIRSLPELQEHFAGQKRWPFFGPMAHFGGGGPEPLRE